MTIATIKSVAARFLANKKPEVMVLKGAWGVGKTYAWHKLVCDNKDKIELPYYCYVSLFGISSLAELRLAIFAKTRSVKLIGQRLDAKTINKEWKSLSSERIKSLTSIFSKFKDVPYIKHLTIGLDTIAPHLIGNVIICLDDFERLNKNNISADELLGFISSLKEEKGCKIVLIFNEYKLGNHKEAYQEYREKIIDLEMEFAPTAEEAVELAFPANMHCRDIAKQCSLSLDIKNIRVLRKIVSMIEMVYAEIINLHQNVKQQAVSTIVLLAYVYY